MTELNHKCWKQLTSNSYNKYYFFNVETGESQWNFPNSLYPLPIHWNRYKSKTTESYYYVNFLTGEKTWKKPSGKQYLPPEEEIIVEGWKTKKSSCGNVYYINNSNDTTTWKKPIKKSLGVQEATVYDSYYTTEKHPTLMYSDHAPILYPINPYINIITWNVAQYGNIYNKQYNTYNHKFNMSRLETEDQYKLRLQNIVNAIDNLVNSGVTNNGEDPFVFLQELPNAHGSFKYAKKDKQMEFKILFNNLLRKKQLINISFNDRPFTEDNNSEFGLIVRSSSHKKIEYLDDFTPTFKELLDSLKCEVYSTLFYGRSIVYVNLHMKYEDDFKNSISLKLTRVTQGLYKFIKPTPSIIYFIGDFNNNIFEDNFVINKMNESFRGVHMPIKNIEKYTTPGNKGYSLHDNLGNENPENIDGIIKVEFT